MRLLFIIGLLLCSGTGAWARLGLVRTADGRTLQGQVRFTPGRVVVVNAAQGSVWREALTNITLISFPTNSITSSSTAEAADTTLPSPWRETEIGFTRQPGSTRHEGGIFTVRGAGMNMDGEADAFHYVFKPVTGDSEIVAEVVSIQYTHPNAKAGLMMRESLNEYARNVTLALTAERGGGLQFRAEERAMTLAGATRAIFAPMWIKLRRQGNEFSSFISRDGRRWTALEKIAVPMRTNIYVGLAVAGARDGVLNWTTFSKVREAPRLQNEFFTPEVELTSGSILAGRPVFADANELRFAGPPGTMRAPVPRVARVLFQPLNGDLAWKARVGRPGVWVSNGDFIDGEFHRLDGRQLTISSVLYGLRNFDIDDEVLALVLRPRQAQSITFEIETTGGALWLVNQLTSDDGELRALESALGELRLPAHEILEVRRR